MGKNTIIRVVQNQVVAITNRIDISKRPRVVEKKRRIGDWEGDTIIGKAHRGAIAGLVDKKVKVMLLKLVTGNPPVK